MTKKINFKNVIAMLMTVLMVMSVMVASFGSFIIVNATTETSSKATGESSGEPTRNTGVVTNMQWKVADKGTSNGIPWYGNTIRFYYKSGNHSIFRDSSISLSSSNLPTWFNTNGSLSLFDSTSSTGWSTTDGAYTNWLHVYDKNNPDNHYRAICMDPIFDAWHEGDIISTSTNLSKVIRIDNTAETNSNIPEEYKVMRRLMWYSYFGGGGLLSSYATSIQSGYDASFYNYYNNTTNNKILAALNTTSYAGSMQAQYVFLHVAASYISELSVAKSRSSNASTYNYNSTYPALGYTNSKTYHSGTYGNLTVNPQLNSNFNNSTWDADDITNPGWSAVRASNGSSKAFKKLSTSTQNKIASYVNSLRSINADSIPEGFTCYICVTGDTAKQSYVVYSLENRVQIQVLKNYTPTSVSGVNLTGATYGIYTSYNNALNDTDRVTTLTIGNNNYSNVYETLLESSYLELNPTAGGGMCRVYFFYIKELNGPTNVPSGYVWVTDPEVHGFNVEGIGCGTNGYIVQNAIQQHILHIINSTNTLQRSEGYFKLRKDVNPSTYKPYGVQFTVYNDYACTQVATDISLASGSGFTVSNGVITITNNSNTGTYTTGNIKVPFIGTNTSRTLYIKETRGPSNPTTGTWITDPAIHTITVTTEHTSSNPYFDVSGNDKCKFDNSYVSGNGYMQILKKASHAAYDNKVGGTQFKLYSDSNYTTVATGITKVSGNGTYNASTGIVTIANNVSGVGPILQVNLNGNATRTIYIEEITNPTESGGPTWDPSNVGRRWTITIKANTHNTTSNPATLTVFNRDLTETYYVGKVMIKKAMTIDGGSIITNPYNDGKINPLTGTVYDLTGAEYTAYFDAACTDPIPGGVMRIGDYTPIIMPINWPGYSPSDAEYYWSNQISWTMPSSALSGTEPTRADVNAPKWGIIYIKETKGPDQAGNWSLDQTVYQVKIKYRHPNATTNLDEIWEAIPNALNATIPDNTYNTYSINNVTEPKTAYFRLVKRASLDSAYGDTLPSGISYAGAEYTVYNDLACTQIATDIGNNGIIVSDANGYFPSSSGTYSAYLGYNATRTIYVKETKVPNNAPTGYYWDLNPTVYTITLSTGHTSTRPYVMSTRSPMDEPLIPTQGFFRLDKVLPTPFTSVNGAQYTVYTDEACTQKATDISKESGIGTVSAGVITFTTSSTGPLVRVPITVITNTTSGGRRDGNQINGITATRTLYIKETRLPNTTVSGDNRLDYDTTIYCVVISPNNTTATPVIVTSNEPKHITNYGWVQVHKIITGGPTGITGNGIVYGVYDTEAHAADGSYSNGSATGTGVLGTLTIDSTNYSNALRITLGEDIEMRTVYIKEVYAPAPPAGYTWTLDTSVHAVDVEAEPRTTESTPMIEDSTNILEDIPTYSGYVRVQKLVTDGSITSAVGAVYGVYNSQRNAASGTYSNGHATGTGLLGELVITSTGYSNTLQIDLGTNTSGTVYIKEVYCPPAPTGYIWSLDTTVHTVTVTNNHTEGAPATEVSTNILVASEGIMVINKAVTDGDASTTNDLATFNPSGAEYAVYNSQAAATTALAQLQNNGTINSNGLATDVGRNGIIQIIQTGTGQRLSYGSGNITVPILSGSSRELWVIEVKAPDYNEDGTDDPSWHWENDTTIHHITVTAGGSATVNSRISSTNTVVRNDTNKVYIRVTKSVTGALNGDIISPEGAIYGIYDTYAHANDATYDTSTNTPTATGLIGTVTIGSNGISNIFTIDIGYATSTIVYVKELTTPPDTATYTWNIDTNVHTCNITLANYGSVSSPYNVNSTNSVTYRPVSLTITKTVTGNMGDKAQVFTFTVYITDASNTPLTGSYTAQLNGNNTTVTFNNGRFTIGLSHGDVFYLGNLPYGSHYTVTETTPANYTMTSTNSTGILYGDKTAAFINDCSTSVPTGIPMTLVAGVALLLPSGAGIMLMRKKRKNSEE